MLDKLFVSLRDYRPAPVNSFDVAEDALLEMSRLQRDVWRDRWAMILIDAGEGALAVEMAAEARAEIAVAA